MKQKILRAGNSIAVVVPSEFVNLVGVCVGDDVEVKSEPEKGKLIYVFKGVRQLKLTPQ